MGTEFVFTVYARPGDDTTADVVRIAREAFAAVDDLEARVSRWRPQSKTTLINPHAGRKPVRVAPDVFRLIQRCGALYQDTDGCFDITVGPLIALWSQCRRENRLPGPEELAPARAQVGFDGVVLDEEERTVSFARPGMRLDFDGIAKGLALDRAAEVLREQGVTAALLNGGTSTILAIGSPPHKSGWTVRIRNPYNRAETLVSVVLADAAFSSSGNYDRTFEVGGKQYGHIVDPRTGWPVEGLLMAAALAPTGALSDGLSTAFFVLGVAGARDYCREHTEVRAILVPVSKDGRLEPLCIDFRSERNPP